MLQARRKLSGAICRVVGLHAKRHESNIKAPGTTSSSPLRSDIRLLGNVLGDIIRNNDPEVFAAVERLRQLGRNWRDSADGHGDPKAFNALVEEVERIDAPKLMAVSRAFTHFLALSNSAENHHRRLLEEKRKSIDEVFHALSTQQVEIVLTAHPTEVNRRTMLQKHTHVKEILSQLDRSDQTAEIASIWETDELRRSKPSPVEEATGGRHVVSDVLWQAVPQFLRKLDDVCQQELGKKLPLDVTPVKLASWMGGDRDGNPNVTPEITREVAANSREISAKLLLKDVKKLIEELSLQKGSEELVQATGNAREPYRHVLRALRDSLISTKKWAKHVMEPLLMLHRSLVSIGRPEIADGALTDTIRRLAAFGLGMMPLDIRQESTRHSEALDAITNYLDLEGFSPTVVDTLETFELIADLTSGSLGAYVISQCQQASDVLAVRLLQQDAGVSNVKMMRVVPLFETLDDLHRSADTVKALFSMPVYKSCIDGRQEIMVGYSDSAKDAGRLAASWAQYRCQVDMAKIAKEHEVEMTFFHGKGGTVGRGGNPQTYQAILAHPPNTINGRFRVTEQGEMITQNLGAEAAAERTLDLMSAGVLSERFEERPEPLPEWAATMERLSEISCAAYRKVVRDDSRFVPYFRAATPELELSGLNVGSRPAKRNPKGGVESLRAIPWVFAWTQTRLNLPAWLGVGDAISSEEANGHLKTLQEMYSKWPWFHTVIDLLEMILAKSESRIAMNYDKQLVTDKESLVLGEELRKSMDVSVQAVLSVSGNPELQSENLVLRRSMAVRNPYIDPLNVIQAELLKRSRAGGATEAEDRLLRDALLITINGVAAGMRNSG
eukprot:GSChrysophyteH2.ASY1.ANO1.572.1 assembled CDS